MCLIVIGIEPRPRSRVLLLANRDEFHARASAPVAPWVEDANVVGGRDLVAGGSWLAVRRDGRFAAVTNVRNGLPRPAPRSRGDLVRDYVLSTETATDYLARLRAHVDLYAPFNLVLGDASDVRIFDGSSGRTRTLGPGLHAVSNGPIDTPWPKMQRLKSLTKGALGRATNLEAFLPLLRDDEIAPDDQLPDTGLGLTRERMLSSIFIEGNDSGYGTRASTVLEIDRDGQVDIVEASFGSSASPAGHAHWACRDGTKAWQRVV